LVLGTVLRSPQLHERHAVLPLVQPLVLLIDNDSESWSTTCCPSSTWAMLASGSIFTVRVAPMYSGGTLYQLLFTLTNASVDTRAGTGVGSQSYASVVG
jgi:hypothetical protein